MGTSHSRERRGWEGVTTHLSFLLHIKRVDFVQLSFLLGTHEQASKAKAVDEGVLEVRVY
jgi:hypothetical protein